jgi:hypothetical protein
VSLPAGRQQGEQDRASPVQLHQPKLARQAAHQLRAHCQSHRRHDHGKRLKGASRTR